MTGFYVFLAIAGLICVIVSFLLTEKLDEKKAFDTSNIPDEVIAAIVEKNSYAVQKALAAQMEAAKDRTVEDTTILLNRITNEKIMAVDEFSDTVIEKINQNHSEVIFLYNMLNEKEKELKELVASSNQVVTKNAQARSEKEKKETQIKKAPAENARGKQKATSKTSTVSDKKDKLVLTEKEKKQEAHTREEILEMHEEGMSVTDIAQRLKMGKGEIKLIIDLYQGAKG